LPYILSNNYQQLVEALEEEVQGKLEKLINSGGNPEELIQTIEQQVPLSAADLAYLNRIQQAFRR
jgi:hypothetical protein